MPSAPGWLLCLAALALVVPGAWAASVPPLDPAGMPERAIAAAEGTAKDPQATVANPTLLTDQLLDGGEPGETTPAPPARDPPPGFADRVRDAFENRAVMAGAASAMIALVGALSAFGLVTRYISPKEALQNPQRAMLYGFVRGNPGVHLKKLSEEFAMKTSSILWHIRKLESAQLVRSERANGFRVFYPVDGGIEIRRVSRALSALQNLNARAIFQSLDRSPGASAADLANRLGIHGGTVRWHLRKLREYGLVEELVRDDGSVFFGTLLGRKALAGIEGMPTEPAPAVPNPMTAARIHPVVVE